MTNERMDTPLHYASYCAPSVGSGDVIVCFLTGRANINARNKGAESPLINAAINNNPEIFKVLLEHKADVGQRNSSEKTALDIATEGGCTEILQLLVQNKEIMARSYAGAEALQHQALLADVYGEIAAAATREMDAPSLSRLAAQTIQSLRTALEQTSSAPLGQSVLMPQQFWKALLTLRFVTRSRDSGGALLVQLGALDVVHGLEQYSREYNLGQVELEELRACLSTARHLTQVSDNAPTLVVPS